MLKEAPAAYARLLQEAETSRRQVRQFSSAEPGMTIDDAYEIQKAWMDLKLAAGRRIIGHKIGLTSKAMQSASRIDEPDYGVLLDDMLYAENEEIPYVRFIEPRIEVELAFVLNEWLPGPSCTILDVLRSTEYVLPALELIDARIERFDGETGAQDRPGHDLG